jgi:DivIVA domain-containing protein
LDRVEATLAGKPIGEPVRAQDVHDVVFRVRFGGYDEWQVDLHLDRVERQLAELEERGLLGRGPADSHAAPPERMGPPPPPVRTAPPPPRDDRGMAPIPPPLPPRPMPAQAGPPPSEYGPRYDEPTGGFGGYGDRQGYPRTGVPAGPGGPGGFGGPEERFDGFESGRHARADVTAEIRMPDSDFRTSGTGMPPVTPPPLGSTMGGPGVGRPAMGASGVGGPGLGGPPMGGPAMDGPGMGGPAGMGADPAMQRVDQIRRTFQVRRFGSGYDPQQVDRFFEEILAAMAGRGPMPVHENDLDNVRFGLVTGGYFEAEVDAALKEVKEILQRRR